jgi:hypothetical protein
VTKYVEIDPKKEFIRLGDIISQFDEKLKKELENRMVSFLSNSMKSCIYVGNFWIERPALIHKDISDAKLYQAKVQDILGGDNE